MVNKTNRKIQLIYKVDLGVTSPKKMIVSFPTSIYDRISQVRDYKYRHAKSLIEAGSGLQLPRLNYQHFHGARFQER